MLNKVLIIVGDASETVDTLYPYYRLQEDGFEPVVAAPEKRKYQMVMHEVKPGWTITKEWEGYTIDANITFADIKPADYAGIFFSGGRAPEYIREDEHLLRATRWFFERNKPVASVCHGVEIPARAGCVSRSQHQVRQLSTEHHGPLRIGRGRDDRRGAIRRRWNRRLRNGIEPVHRARRRAADA